MNLSVQFNGPWLRIEGVVVSSASVAAAGRPPVDLTVLTRQKRAARRPGPHPAPAAAGRHDVLRGGERDRRGAGRRRHAGRVPFALAWDFSTPGIEPAASLKVVVERVTRTRVHLRVDLLSTEPRWRGSACCARTPLVRVTRRISGPSERFSLPRPRGRITSVGVLLRGSPTHVGVAARLATDIKAVSALAPVVAARR